MELTQLHIHTVIRGTSLTFNMHFSIYFNSIGYRIQNTVYNALHQRNACILWNRASRLRRDYHLEICLNVNSLSLNYTIISYLHSTRLFFQSRSSQKHTVFTVFTPPEQNTIMMKKSSVNLHSIHSSIENSSHWWTSYP